jgi:Ca2+-transporting ATPase
MSDAQRNTLKEKIRVIGGQGFRMMAVAIGLDGGNMKQVTVDNAKQQLADSSQYQQLEGGNAFLGYVCIKDPVRPEVSDAIAECKTAGINGIMITGDAKETAVSIAK